MSIPWKTAEGIGKNSVLRKRTVLWEDGMVKSPERWQRAVEKTVRSFSSHVVWGKWNVCLLLHLRPKHQGTFQPSHEWNMRFIWSSLLPSRGHFQESHLSVGQQEKRSVPVDYQWLWRALVFLSTFKNVSMAAPSSYLVTGVQLKGRGNYESVSCDPFFWSGFAA